MFTVSNIYSAKEFLGFIKKEDFSEKLIRESLGRYKYSQTENILNLSFNCKWCTINKFGDLVPTQRGSTISEVEYQEALFYQLEDIINNFEPSWASIIFQGREAAKSYLPDEILQCFKDAGLLENKPTKGLVEKWDRLARAHISSRNDELLEIGREGERLSIQFENKRTGEEPVWQSIEANFAGYDLLSIESSENSKPLKIEVKSTKVGINSATFVLSRGEYLTAKTGGYVFHFWDIPKAELYVADYSLIRNHIPTDKGRGEWTKVRIPYKEIVKRVIPKTL